MLDAKNDQQLESKSPHLPKNDYLKHIKKL